MNRELMKYYSMKGLSYPMSLFLTLINSNRVDLIEYTHPRLKEILYHD